MTAFQYLKAKKEPKLEDFPDICNCARILAISFLFVNSYDEKTNDILRFPALPKEMKKFIAGEFQHIFNTVVEIQSRYVLIFTYYISLIFLSFVSRLLSVCLSVHLLVLSCSFCANSISLTIIF
jgi:hypothetical protein